MNTSHEVNPNNSHHGNTTNNISRSGSGSIHHRRYSTPNDTSMTLQHELQLQETIPHEELLDSIASASDQNQSRLRSGESAVNDSIDIEIADEVPDDMGTGMMSSSHIGSDQPTLEQIQRAYYSKGLEELETLQLLDLSPLANWKLSSYKQGCGLPQLREDSPDSLWQSDGSNGNNNINASANGMNNNQLSNPHSVTIQFSKKVSLERISIFTNFTLDESYTPSKIKIMAGSSGWDLSEVCTVNFNKPIGWSHIIFNGIRNDGVLKCFVVKLIILANHQDGKDSHIRAIRCFGKKSAKTNISVATMAFGTSKGNGVPFLLENTTEIDASTISGYTNQSGVLLNHRNADSISHLSANFGEKLPIENDIENASIIDEENSKVLGNVADVIGFNAGFQSIELTSTSSIR